jgi:hypothetical protein
MEFYLVMQLFVCNKDLVLANANLGKIKFPF